MGCCTQMNKNMTKNKEVLIISEEMKKQYKDIKDSNTDFQITQKKDKEEVKKEKSTSENQNSQKINKMENKEDLSLNTCSPPFKNPEEFKNIQLKVNKNKVLKRGSHRVQLAMKELKMLSMEEINKNKKKFFN